MTGQSANGYAFFKLGEGSPRAKGSRLQTKLRKIESLIDKLKAALQDGKEAIERGREELAAAEAKRAELGEQAAQVVSSETAAPKS